MSNSPSSSSSTPVESEPITMDQFRKLLAPPFLEDDEEEEDEQPAHQSAERTNTTCQLRESTSGGTKVSSSVSAEKTAPTSPTTRRSSQSPRQQKAPKSPAAPGNKRKQASPRKQQRSPTTGPKRPPTPSRKRPPTPSKQQASSSRGIIPKEVKMARAQVPAGPPREIQWTGDNVSEGLFVNASARTEKRSNVASPKKKAAPPLREIVLTGTEVSPRKLPKSPRVAPKNPQSAARKSPAKSPGRAASKSPGASRSTRATAFPRARLSPFRNSATGSSNANATLSPVRKRGSSTGSINATVTTSPARKQGSAAGTSNAPRRAGPPGTIVRTSSASPNRMDSDDDVPAIKNLSSPKRRSRLAKSSSVPALSQKPRLDRERHEHQEKDNDDDENHTRVGIRMEVEAKTAPKKKLKRLVKSRDPPVDSGAAAAAAKQDVRLEHKLLQSASPGMAQKLRLRIRSGESGQELALLQAKKDKVQQQDAALSPPAETLTPGRRRIAVPLQKLHHQGRDTLKQSFQTTKQQFGSLRSLVQQKFSSGTGHSRSAATNSAKSSASAMNEREEGKGSGSPRGVLLGGKKKYSEGQQPEATEREEDQSSTANDEVTTPSIGHQEKKQLTIPVERQDESSSSSHADRQPIRQIDLQRGGSLSSKPSKKKLLLRKGSHKRLSLNSAAEADSTLPTTFLSLADVPEQKQLLLKGSSLRSLQHKVGGSARRVIRAGSHKRLSLNHDRTSEATASKSTVSLADPSTRKNQTELQKGGSVRSLQEQHHHQRASPRKFSLKKMGSKKRLSLERQDSTSASTTATSTTIEQSMLRKRFTKARSNPALRLSKKNVLSEETSEEKETYDATHLCDTKDKGHDDEHAVLLDSDDEDILYFDETEKAELHPTTFLLELMPKSSGHSPQQPASPTHRRPRRAQQHRQVHRGVSPRRQRMASPRRMAVPEAMRSKSYQAM